MSTKDPNLKVIFGSDTKDFDKGCKDVKQGLKDIGRDASEFGGAMKTAMGKGAAAVAAVTAAVAGTIAIIKDLAQQNQALGDAWERTCEGMKGAFDSFKTAVANMDFTNLFTNMREASRLARDLYDARDGLGEVQTSYNIALARQQKTINQLRLDMADMSKTEEERVAAGNKLLKIYEDLEKNPTRSLLNISEKSLDVIANKLGYTLKDLPEEELKKTRRYVEQFFIWLGTEAGEAWNSAYGAAFADPAKLWQTTINAQNAGLSDAYRAMLWNYQGAVGDKDREAMEQAIVAYYNQEAKYSEETLKIRKQINSLQVAGAKQDEKSSAASAKAALAERKKAEAEIQEMLTYMAKRQENNDLYGNAFAGISKVSDIRAFTGFGGLATLRDEYQSRLTAELGDLTIYVGIKPKKDTVINLTQEINSLLETSINRTGEIMGDLIGTLAAGGDAWGDFKNAAVSALGDLAIAVGKIAIKMGLAAAGIDVALKDTGQWYIAVAAGAALVALGTAVKSSLSAAASGDYSASGGGYSGGYATSSSGGDWETREVNVNVTGTLVADGDQLVTVINNTNKKNYYLQ